MKHASAGFLVYIVIGLSILVGPLAFATDITVSGGTLKEFNPGTLSDFGTNAVPVFGPHGFRLGPAATGTNTFHMYVDMGSNRWVSTVTVLNRNAATALQFGLSHIYAAADETAGGFDPANLAGYGLDVHTTGSPTPSVYDASVLRTNTLTRAVYRRYLRYDLLGNFSGSFPSPGWEGGDAGDLNVGGTAPGNAVAAGTLYAMAGTDKLVFGAAIGLPVGNFAAVNADGDSVIRLLLDLGSRKGVKTLVVINRTDADTLYNIMSLNVKTAPNEGQASFDPQIHTNFTTTIGSGGLSPETYIAGIRRTMNLPETWCRYIMLDITANFNAAIDSVHGGGVEVETLKGTIVAVR